MVETKSYIGLKKKFKELPDETKSFLKGLESLLESPETFSVALAFIFMKLEEGNHRALKCGLIRIDKCNSAKVDEALEKQHFTRAYFRSVFKNVFGDDLNSKLLGAIKVAEGVRDRLIHGKGATSPELRKGIENALVYVVELGAYVEGRTKKNPFGNLQGLAGKATLMDTVPSYWLLKGLGLYNDKSSN
ncbi:MAG: hypothetical protein P8N12_03460 [Porticoccaceae bacterium]|nr:hypothetical protein [Porticoccaceae bacterium]